MLTFKQAQSVSKRALLIVCAFLLSAGSIIAQNINVTGKVTDKTGEPLIGVYVVEEGTSNGISTDLDGKFQLVVDSKGKLVFSLIGMKTKYVSVEGRTNLDIVMEEDAMLLDDVVVVGYGTQKKENLTGAVASVDVGKTLTARAITDVGRGLQGSTPGLTITIPSGEVGSDPIMKIRGQIGSIEGGSSPLILLDNVEIPSLSLVNPNDIESISVLKDAASASIYGAKAAFGVILITTKKGAKTESVNVSYSGNVAFQNIAKKMEMAGVDGMEYSVLCAERVGATEYGALNWYVSRESWQKAVEWQNKYGNTVNPHDDMLYGRDWYVDPANPSKKYGIRTYDPYDYMIDEWTPSQNHNVAINGKSGKVSYNASFGYVDQQGILQTAKKDDYQRYNGAVKISADINDYITVRAGGMYSKQLKSYPYSASTTADPWLYLYRWGPTYPYTTEDGQELRGAPYEIGASNTATRETNYTNFNVGATITPLKDWEINFDYSFANQEYIQRHPGTRFTAKDIWSAPVAKLDDAGNQIYVNNSGNVVDAGTEGAMAAYEFKSVTYTGAGASPDHIYRIAKNEMWNTFNVNTTYDLNINDAHAFKFMVGLNSSAYQHESHWGQKTSLVDYENPQFDLATGTQTTGGAAGWESQFGVFGRINYNYKERYLAEVNVRYDGTSKFPTDMQWRTFPSFSLGWRMSEESWMGWAKPVLSTLKFRGSYGTIGDQTVANSLYVPVLTGATTNWIIGSDKLYKFNTPNAVSQSITWQDITTLDLGFDARFFSGELGVTFDWYRRDANNMIVPQEGIPYTFGTGAPKSNYGSLRTNGYEIQIDYNHRFDNGLGINVVGTFADAITKVTKYGDTKSIDDWYVGKTYGEIWGYETDRLYQKEDFEYDGAGNLQIIEVDGYKVYKLKGDNAVYQGKLQSGNFMFGPGDVKFVDLNGDGKINDGNRLIENAEGKADYGDLKVIGNETPRYEYSLRLALDYKGFDFSIFGQGVGKREIWGAGFLAIPGFNAADGAMPQAIAGDFWREDRTDAFYPRPYNMGGSNTGNNMQKQDRYLLDMSYFRIKNITLGYTLPENLTKKAWISKLRIYVALENFFTIDHLNGLPIDPEAISGYSMFNTTNYNLGRTGMGTPAFKNVSVGLELNF